MRLTVYLHQSKFGQSLLEYSLAAGLIALVCVGALSMLGGDVNKGFHSILPPPGSGTMFKDGASSDSDKSTKLSDQGTSGNQNSNSSSSKVLEQYQSIVQTAGSLGDEKVLFGYSDQLVAHASKLQDENPALFNRIVQLGIVGKKMGKLMTAYQQSPSRANNTILGNSTLDYDKVWMLVQQSAEYQHLSEADKALIHQLSMASMNLAGDVLGKNGQVVNPGGMVDGHSNQIITCGQNETCN